MAQGTTMIDPMQNPRRCSVRTDDDPEAGSVARCHPHAKPAGSSSVVTSAACAASVALVRASRGAADGKGPRRRLWPGGFTTTHLNLMSGTPASALPGPIPLRPVGPRACDRSPAGPRNLDLAPQPQVDEPVLHRLLADLEAVGEVADEGGVAAGCAFWSAAPRWRSTRADPGISTRPRRRSPGSPRGRSPCSSVRPEVHAHVVEDERSALVEDEVPDSWAIVNRRRRSAWAR